MKLIKPYFEIIEQKPGEIGMFKHIETCGRVAWKSEERTTDDSYLKFIEMLKGVNHGSVLEHGTVYLYFTAQMFDSLYERYEENKYSILSNPHGYSCYVTTNYRVLQENNWLDDLKYQCEPTKFHEKRVTVRLVIDRGVSHEFVRHRTFSFTQESTRYCNYSKDKFGGDITFIQPVWLEDLNTRVDDVLNYKNALKVSEQSYMNLLNFGWKPQQARAVLPNSLKTELIMTGFISDWKHFFHLRTAIGAHPQAQEIAIPLQEEFRKLNLI